MIAQACGLVTANDKPSTDSSSIAGSSGSSEDGGGTGSGGTGSSGTGSGGTGGLVLVGGGGQAGGAAPACDPAPLLADQAMKNVGSQRVFFSWTTEEQVDELRAGADLFSRSERPGKGRGQLFDTLAQIAATPGNPGAKLAEVLGTEVFAKQRYAWTNPWATLLGFPGESYGDQLLQIELEPDAWIAEVDVNGVVSVVDANNDPVSVEAALQTPERVGAIFHMAPGDDTKTHCGTFSAGAVGYREFALGNLAMVKRWSLATPEIEERLRKDSAVLQALSKELACLDVPSDWLDRLSCDWDGSHGGEGALENYGQSLALPSELYRPIPENLEALVAALEASLPTGSPLVVIPEK
jgi:hypothetical protein